MPMKYVVRLSPKERELQDLVSNRKTPAYRIRHAHVLLKPDAEGPARLDRQITEVFSCNRPTFVCVYKIQLIYRANNDQLVSLSIFR